MAPVEIIFVLLGIGILLVSCFMHGEKEEKTETGALLSGEFAEVQKQELERYADRILTEKSEETIVRTDDYLSKVSNEKIMAFHDFSAQILEKIDANHKEVVFLYDMLNQKEDELKETVRQFEVEKDQLREAVDDIARLTQRVNATQKTTSEARKVKKTDTLRTTAVPETVTATENRNNGQMEFTEMLPADRQKEEVLRLHKQGKSVLEISKAMGMGQGEVKLIIGLYGA